MKKVILIIFLTACLGARAQAGMVVFDFQDDDLAAGANSDEIGIYMSKLYGSPVTVTGAMGYSDVGPLSDLYNGGDDLYIADEEQGQHEFRIFFSVPITSVSFDWAREDDPFKVEAIYADGTVQIFSAGTGVDSGGSGSGTEKDIDLLAMLGSPVTGLYFHDGGQGSIGIDNLMVSAVPLPTSLLLALFAVGTAGRKLRKFV